MRTLIFLSGVAVLVAVLSLDAAADDRSTNLSCWFERDWAPGSAPHDRRATCITIYADGSEGRDHVRVLISPEGDITLRPASEAPRADSPPRTLAAGGN